jgi:hypothetical protein
MKKIILLITFSFSIFSFSQISLSRHNLIPIIDGQVVAFNSAVYPVSELDFYVKNNSTTVSTNVKINCVALLNNDGAGFELCFGSDCLSSVEEGMSYPINQPYVTLAPGASSGNEGHFLNTNASSGVFPRDYTFRFYQVGTPSGNTIDVTYRYDPNLTVDEINQLETSGVILKSSLIDNQLDLDVLKAATMEIYDLNGKLVLNTKLDYGVQSVEVSNFASGVYIINFISEKGITSKKKFIKK